MTQYFRKPVSQTFHGRDIFAPVAAHIAAGVLPSRMGKLIDDYLRPAFQTPVRTGKRTWNGQVLKVDRFGNIVTNYHVEEFPEPGSAKTSHSASVREQVTVLARNYAETQPRRAFRDRRQLGLLRDLGEPGVGGESDGLRGGKPGRADDLVANSARSRFFVAPFFDRRGTGGSSASA